MTNLNIILFIVFTGLISRADEFKRSMPYLIIPPTQVETHENLSEIILPKSLSSDESSATFVAKVVDNSLDYVWNRSGLKNTSVGRAADAIDKNLKAEVSIGDESDKSKPQHTFSFKLLATQALAKLEYKGWIKAVINYDAKSAKTEAEVFENLANNKDLVITHSVTSNESKSQLSLRWNW